jgi:dipeptidyl aminopeptidase/acylaminoacyl peptidase
MRQAHFLDPVRVACVAALSSVALACAPLGVATDAPVPVHDAATFYDTTSISGASFSADGKRLLVTSDESGTFNAYAVDLATGERTALTRSTTDAIFAIDWFPDDDRFLYTADQGGNELNHLYVQAPDGRVVDLTPGERAKAGFQGWAGDGRSFFVTTNERDPRFFDVHRYWIEAPVAAVVGAPYPRETLYRNDVGFNVQDVSRDGRWVALVQSKSNADSDVWLVDTERPGSEPLHVTPHEGDVEHGVASFAPDGSALYYTSNEQSEFVRVWSYDLASGERAVVHEDDWDVQFYRFSRDGRHLMIGVNADARTLFTLLDAQSGKRVKLPDFPAGDVRGVEIRPGGSEMALYVNGDTSPSNLWVVDLDTRKARALTETLTPAIDPADLVASEVVRYPSFDGLDVPALLYRPHGASAERPVPALVWVHGGPGGQSRTGYNPTLQHLVNHGYAVLAVNNRGSSGYGKTFFHADDRRHGDVDLQDCIYGRRYLEGLEWVDGERVGIIGGSYGGYMVVAALAFQPEAFEVGVDIFGV